MPPRCSLCLACPFVIKLSGCESIWGLEMAAADGSGLLNIPWSECPTPPRPICRRQVLLECLTLLRRVLNFQGFGR